MEAEEQTPTTAKEFWIENPRSFRVQPRMDMEMISLDSAIQFAEQYAELRIQQEREKWKEMLKEEVVKTATNMFIGLGYGVKTSNHMANEYYENEVKPRIESK